ncbi:MAG: OadG family transporter subunit [Pseudomonadales bacterium]|nr:OadG family transporter subunit [Pseudomonadales bacterium]
MNSTDLLAEGLSLMLLGMGTVFVFLIILVFATSTMSTLVRRYVPENPPVPVKSGPGGQLNDQRVLAVISAAIHAHRNK